MSLPYDIQKFLASFRSISLEKTEKVKLMHRIDTKYLISVDKVIGLLQDIRQDYQVLDVESHRVGNYKSTYYDTSDLQMFYSHITGRYPRYKVRERHYSQNNQRFFEVKQKSNKGRTYKRRIALTENKTKTSDWLSKQSPFRADELTLALMNSFERITLINNDQTERITLDFNLQFRSPSGYETPVYDRVVIVELKQEKSINSPIKISMRSKGIHPCRVSKFCIGMFITGGLTSYKKYKPNYSLFIKTQLNDPFEITGCN